MSSSKAWFAIVDPTSTGSVYTPSDSTGIYLVPIVVKTYDKTTTFKVHKILKQALDEFVTVDGPSGPHALLEGIKTCPALNDYKAVIYPVLTIKDGVGFLFFDYELDVKHLFGSKGVKFRRVDTLAQALIFIMTGGSTSKLRDGQNNASNDPPASSRVHFSRDTISPELSSPDASITSLARASMHTSSTVNTPSGQSPRRKPHCRVCNMPMRGHSKDGCSVKQEECDDGNTLAGIATVPIRSLPRSATSADTSSVTICKQEMDFGESLSPLILPVENLPSPLHVFLLSKRDVDKVNNIDQAAREIGLYSARVASAKPVGYWSIVGDHADAVGVLRDVLEIRAGRRTRRRCGLLKFILTSVVAMVAAWAVLACS